MKNLKNICFASVILLSFTAFGQKAKDTIRIDMGKSKLILISDDMENEIAKMKVDSILQVVKQQVGGSFANTTDTQLVKTFVLDSTIKKDSIASKDTLSKGYFFSINFSVAIGTARNTFAPSFVIGARVVSQSKKPGYFLQAEPYYFFSKNAAGNFNTDINLFINGGITFPFYLGRRQVDMGFGMLVMRQGKYFEKNTFKIFTTTNILNLPIYISPELFLVGGFRKVYPGLSIRVGF